MEFVIQRNIFLISGTLRVKHSESKNIDLRERVSQQYDSRKSKNSFPVGNEFLLHSLELVEISGIEPLTS